MASKLTKPVTREIPVACKDGVEGFAHVTMADDGIVVRGKGTQRELTITWSRLAEVATAPNTMPAKYADNPMGWLIDRPAKKS